MSFHTPAHKSNTAGQISGAPSVTLYEEEPHTGRLLPYDPYAPVTDPAVRAAAPTLCAIHDAIVTTNHTPTPRLCRHCGKPIARQFYCSSKCVAAARKARKAAA